MFKKLRAQFSPEALSQRRLARLVQYHDYLARPLLARPDDEEHKKKLYDDGYVPRFAPAKNGSLSVAEDTLEFTRPISFSMDFLTYRIERCADKISHCVFIDFDNGHSTEMAFDPNVSTHAETQRKALKAAKKFLGDLQLIP